MVILGCIQDNFSYWGDWPQSQHSVQATVSHFADDFLQGDHEFKVGGCLSTRSADGNGAITAASIYYDWDGYPYYAYFMNPEEYGGVTRRTSAFLDDSWSITDRLTLNLGVRFDHIRGGYPEYDRLDDKRKPDRRNNPGGYGPDQMGRMVATAGTCLPIDRG